VLVQRILKGKVSLYCRPLVLLGWNVLFCKLKLVSCHMADSKQVKLDVNGTVILHPQVFLVSS
jgi:hypothetical protein